MLSTNALAEVAGNEVAAHGLELLQFLVDGGLVRQQQRLHLQNICYSAGQSYPLLAVDVTWQQAAAAAADRCSRKGVDLQPLSTWQNGES